MRMATVQMMAEPAVDAVETADSQVACTLYLCDT